ncbi:MAG: hypothetical protein OHK0046_24190 [Anaerolineae bacterium]
MVAQFVKAIIDEMATWDGVTVHPHRFGGREFNIGNVEIGHVHSNGMVDIPFTRTIRAQLIAEGMAEPHHLLPETGWISFYLRKESDVAEALKLFRLSYIQKVRSRSRRDDAQRAALQQQIDALNVSDTLKGLVAVQ